MKPETRNQTKDLTFVIWLLSSLLVIGGCAGHTPETNLVTAPAIPSSTAPVPRSAFRISSSMVVLPPPVLSGFVLHFIFPRALTNCYLQSSTDLIHWENRYDFSLETNFDGSIGWYLPLSLSKPCEFYRTGGESIP